MHSGGSLSELDDEALQGQAACQKSSYLKPMAGQGLDPGKTVHSWVGRASLRPEALELGLPHMVPGEAVALLPSSFRESNPGKCPHSALWLNVFHP